MKHINSPRLAPGVFAACGRLTCLAWCCDPRLPAPTSRRLHQIQSSHRAAETPAPGKGSFLGGLCQQRFDSAASSCGHWLRRSSRGQVAGSERCPQVKMARNTAQPTSLSGPRLVGSGCLGNKLCTGPACAQKALEDENAGPEPARAGCKRELQPFPVAKPG